jgi:hypothetical protein
LEVIGIRKISLKLIGCEVDSFGSEYKLVVGSYELSNVSFGFIKG